MELLRCLAGRIAVAFLLVSSLPGPLYPCSCPATCAFGIAAVEGQETQGKDDGFAPADGACGDVGPWIDGMCLSDGEGNENGSCEPCLVGEEWDALREELGTELVRGTRKSVPTIKHPQWLSGTLSGTVIHILLKEMLGYDRIRVATTDSRFEIEEAASDTCRAINMEVWHTEPHVDQDLLVSKDNAKPGKAIFGYSSVIGLESLFVPKYLPFSSTHYQALHDNVPENRNGNLSRPMDVFPPDGTIGLEQLDSLFPDGDPWGCFTDAFSEGGFECNTGRWYPPQCGTEFPSKHCKELYIPDQKWSAGWFEAAILNNQLNFSVVYTSYDGFLEIIRDKFEKREGMMFYWWEPEPLLLNYPSLRVTFPSHTSACQATYNNSPRLSGVDCERDMLALRKLIYADFFNTDPDMYFLWDSAVFSNPDIESLMGFHVNGGGNHTGMYDSACAWLKLEESKERWKKWLKIEPCAGLDPPQLWDPASRRCVSGGASQAGTINVKVIAIAIAVLVAVLLAGVWIFRHRVAKLLKQPPKAGEVVTLVITDIQGSTSLWDVYPNEVAEAIALHHYCLRKSLQECNGYEVATEGDSFKCAFRTPEDAITWAVLVQLDLLCAPWDPVVEDGGYGAVGNHKWADPAKLRGMMRLKSASFRGAGYGSNFLDSGYGGKKTRKPPFDTRGAGQTAYSMAFCHQNPMGSLRYMGGNLPIPVFRGLRVRIGIHTGVADVVETHENTKRLRYGGRVEAIAKAVSECPAGGQIVASAETIAAVSSMQDLMQKLRLKCKGWSSALCQGDSEADGMCIIHMGSHLLHGVPAAEPDAAPESPARFYRTGQTRQVSFRMQQVASMTVQSTPLLETVIREQIEKRLGVSFLSGDTVSNQLAKAQDLVMILPRPLRARQWCFPPLDTSKQLTPGFKEAPGQEGVTILFTHIDKWAKLKRQALRDSALKEVLDSTRAQASLMVRALLLPMRGYEVEGEDGCFVLAFHTPEEAVEYAVLLLRLLRSATWNERLTSLPECSPVMDDSGDVLLVGPRLKVGMCTGDTQVCQPSMRTGRTEYFGWVMNHAARVASTASGGQTLVHGGTFSALKLQQLDPSIKLKYRGSYQLKGIRSRVPIFEASDRQLNDHDLPDHQQDMDDSALQHMLELIGSSTLQRQACGKANSIDSYQPPSTIRAADWPGLDDAEYGLSLGVPQPQYSN